LTISTSFQPTYTRPHTPRNFPLNQLAVSRNNRQSAHSTAFFFSFFGARDLLQLQIAVKNFLGAALSEKRIVFSPLEHKKLRFSCGKCFVFFAQRGFLFSHLEMSPLAAFPRNQSMNIFSLQRRFFSFHAYESPFLGSPVFPAPCSPIPHQETCNDNRRISQPKKRKPETGEILPAKDLERQTTIPQTPFKKAIQKHRK